MFYDRNTPQSPFFLPFVIVTAALQVLALQHAFSQEVKRITPLAEQVANHYLVVYRNATIPGDAIARTAMAGAKVLAQHTHLGMAVVQANGTADDATNLRQLAAQPDVDFVVHDRMVYAHQVTTAPSVTYRNPIVRPTTPVTALPMAPAVPVATPAPAAPTAAAPSVPAAPVAPVVPVVTTDSFYSTPQGWAVRQVGGYGKGMNGGKAKGPWDVTMGKGVKIAILDSGVDASHPDIAPNLIYNLSEIDQNPTSGLPSPCDDGTAQDQQGHGTWVASLAAGAAGAESGKVVGVAPEASILNIKVLERMPNTSVAGATKAQQCGTGQASGLMSWVIKGINDALAQHADVISMSLGSMVDITTGDGAGLKALFDRATYAAAASGAVLVAAAGNDGFNYNNQRYIELPAQARDVLTIVASSNADCAENLTAGAPCVAGAVTLPYYSNHGAPMNALAAPGGNLPAGPDEGVSGWVRGACSTGKLNTTDGLPDETHSFGCFGLGHTQYVQAMGTSAAAPLAAGVAALLRAAHPSWDAATIIAAMRSSAVNSSSLAYGQVNAAAALGLSN